MTTQAPLQIHDFDQRRQLALEVLTRSERLTRKAGSFLGQCVVDRAPLSDAQTEWLIQLAERAGIAVEV